MRTKAVELAAKRRAAKLARLDWAELARTMADSAVALLALGENEDCEIRDRIAAYKEARQQLLAIPAVDNARRERHELDEMRDLKHYIDDRLAVLHGGTSSGNMGAEADPPLDPVAH